MSGAHGTHARIDETEAFGVISPGFSGADGAAWVEADAA
jgi:hypothetical protein